MQPVAASVFTALTDALPGQLAWPAVDLVEREPDSTAALGFQGINESRSVRMVMEAAGMIRGFR